MAIDVKVPSAGESVKQVILLKWHKKDGEIVQTDDPICELETDKANVDVPAPSAGRLRILHKEGETIDVGETIAQIDASAADSGKSPPPARKEAKAEAPSQSAAAVAVVDEVSPVVRKLISDNQLNASSIPATGAGGRLTKEDVTAYLVTKGDNGASKVSASWPTIAPPLPPTVKAKKDLPAAPPPSAAPIPAGEPLNFDAKGIARQPMSKIRKRIAQTLVEAQQTAAILTTFNEVDLTSIIEIRSRFKEKFQEMYGVGLGFMSFFARAVVLGLRDFPRVNAFLDGDDVVYHNYVHLGVAVSTERGLAVPVLRNVQNMGFARIESEIKRLATAVRDGKLAPDELSGGTFTVTNGGVFGSLLSTPILTPPQSGILGMHAIQKRPVVINDKIEIRSMMYVALSYDHRLVDGRESVSFLVRVKQYLEDPARLMLEI